MSRIDEALKRVTQGPVLSRGPSRGTDGSLRLAEDFTLNEYPQEGRAAKVAPEQPVGQPDRAPAAPVRREIRVREGGLRLDSNLKLVVSRECNPLIVEQYRRLAATLHEAQIEKGLKTVMVTSAAPREGKTLTAVNIALTLSESYNRRVLLIDADLRRPSVHELLGVGNEPGLSDVLRADHADIPTVQISARLFVLVSGRTEGNPLAGLSSDRMRSLLDDAATRYDWVLLDTPPVGLLSDSQVLGRLAQASVFVIRSGETPFPAVERAMADLGRDRIIGTVLNAVEDIPSTSYYGNYYQKG